MSRDPIPLYDDLRYPGHGMEGRGDASYEPLSPFGRIVGNQPLGKKVNLLYRASAEGRQVSPVTILELRGMDIDACQMSVTLVGPLAIPRALADLPIDLQNATGEFNNAEVGSAVYPGLENGIVRPPFTAIIKWGVGGARAVAEVDFVNGTVINVPASAIDVLAAVPADAINAPGTTGLYTLAAFVSPGWTRNGTAQRTIALGAIATGDESPIYSIPRFAKAITVVGADQSGGAGVFPALTTAWIRFWSDPGGVHCVGNYYVSGNVEPKFTVPNGAQYFSVIGQTTPTTGATAVDYQACFELAI